MSKQIRLTPEQAAEVVERCRAGEPMRVIASDYGVSVSAVSRRFQEAGGYTGARRPLRAIEVRTLAPRAQPICSNCQRQGDGLFVCFGALDRRCNSPLVSARP